MYIYSTVYLYLQLDIKAIFFSILDDLFWHVTVPVKSTTRAKQHYHCHYFTKPDNISSVPFPTLHQCYPFLLQKQLTDSKPAAFSRSRDNTLQIIKKKAMLSLTEDGRPGGTFRTFFVWISERGEKRQNNAWGFNRHFMCLLEGCSEFDLFKINRLPKEEREQGHPPTTPTPYIYKESFHCKKREIKTEHKKDRAAFFLFASMKGRRAAFDMFILFFRVSLKGSEEQDY